MAVLCALALWELLVRSGVLSDTSFPPMSETVAELGASSAPAPSGPPC